MSQEGRILPTYNPNSAEDREILQKCTIGLGMVALGALMTTGYVAGKVAVKGAKTVKSFIEGFFDAFKDEVIKNKSEVNKLDNIQKREYEQNFQKTLHKEYQPQNLPIEKPDRGDFSKAPQLYKTAEQQITTRQEKFEEQTINKEIINLQSILLKRYAEEKLNRAIKDLEKKGYKLKKRVENDENIVLEYIRIT